MMHACCWIDGWNMLLCYGSSWMYRTRTKRICHAAPTMMSGICSGYGICLILWFDPVWMLPCQHIDETITLLVRVLVLVP